MDYAEISKETVSLLYQSYQSLKKSPLPASLRILLELFVSQMNGCSYCIKMHTDEAVKEGVEQEKIEDLLKWKESKSYSDQEKAAFKWAEEVNHLKQTQDTKQKLLTFFSQREVVDITLCISLMNALNRLAISLKE